MRTAALVLGILAGVFAILGALLVMALGGNQIDSNPAQSNDFIRGSALAFVTAIIGFIGAAMARGRPRLAAILMLIAGFGTFYFIGGFAFLPLVLYLIGAGLAAFSPSPQPA